MSTVSTCPPGVPMTFLGGGWVGGKTHVTSYPVIAIQAVVGTGGQTRCYPIIWDPDQNELCTVDVMKSRLEAFEMLINPTDEELREGVKDLATRVEIMHAKPEVDDPS